jgi:DNA-binding winged helix-turn-helix (wHTH) protein/tetratricopeptide (TPR) repeat protein
LNLETTFPRSQLAAVSAAAELAHRSAFKLGPLTVEPAVLRLTAADGQSITLQPLAMRVLLALADADGETCSRDDLVQICWQQRIVGDDAVHRVISALRRDLVRIVAGSVAIETIPKVGYRLRVEGAPEMPSMAADQTATPRSLKRFWPIAAVLGAGLSLAALFPITRADAEATTIAVVADSARPGDATARFADELTGDLARLASAMLTLAFVEADGEHKRPSPLLLRVSLGNGATARVRLVDGKGGAVVWAREFTAESGSTSELRELVANGITGVVQCGLDRSAEFADPVSLRLYLGACEGLETNDMPRARAFAQQITEHQPNSPAGWACLANTTIFLAAGDGKVTAAVLSEAEGYARRALAADPRSGLAYVALAMAARWRGDPYLGILEQGLRVAPDFAMLHKHYAWGLTDNGMASAAVEPALRAVALLPHDPNHYQVAIVTLLNAGRTKEALALSKTMQGKWRYDPSVAIFGMNMLVHEPDIGAALKTLSENPRREDVSAKPVREALSWRKDPATYEWSQFDRMAEDVYAENNHSAWRLSATAARMGDSERALAWLKRAPADSHHGWSWLFSPETAAVRREPEFFRKMAAVGMVARWRAGGRWPDFCREAGLRYSCAREARILGEARKVA